MPANTPQGYPYPLPTEPVAEGAQAIRNLAEAVKGPKLIYERDLSVLANQVFDSIPAGYDSLRLQLLVRATAASLNTTLHMRFNNNAGAAYFCATVYGDGAAASSFGARAATEFLLASIPAGSSGAGLYSLLELTFLNPNDSTVNYKSYTGNGHSMFGGAAGQVQAFTMGGSFGPAAAVTRIDVFPSGGGAFAAGSRGWLYGLGGA